MVLSGLLPRRAFRLNARGHTLPPGVQVEHFAADGRALTVVLRGAWLRTDTVPHSGAALYALTDPFLVLLLQGVLGAPFFVWDKSGSIDLLGAARGRVWVRLEVGDDDLAQIRRMTDDGERHLHLFHVDLRDADGMAVARVHRLIYVRRRREVAGT
jgi:hypothetical protein